MKQESVMLGELLKQCNLTISTAESCTGGNIAHCITQIAGSSQYFKGSIVSYTNQIKEEISGVNDEYIVKFTEVSGPVAISMAKGVARLMKTDVAVSTTGIAGPTGALPDQPIGTVWISAVTKQTCKVRQYHFSGNREQVIEAATQAALQMVIDILTN